jgi:hypothetical protein
MLELLVHSFITGKLTLAIEVINSPQVNGVCWKREDGTDDPGGGLDGLEGMGQFGLIADLRLDGCYVEQRVGILDDVWVLELPDWPESPAAEAVPSAMWTWVAGHQTVNSQGNFGDGVTGPDPAAPGARRDHAMWLLPAVRLRVLNITVDDGVRLRVLNISVDDGSWSTSASDSGSWDADTALRSQHYVQTTLPGPAEDIVRLAVFGPGPPGAVKLPSRFPM